MKLSEFLEETGIQISKFLSRCKLHPNAPALPRQTFYNVVCNGCDTKISTVLRICAGTGGKCTPQEIYDEYIAKKPKKGKKK